MTKESARKLKKKCRRIASKFGREFYEDILTDKIFLLVRQETRKIGSGL
jgi:hypothetical protein